MKKIFKAIIALCCILCISMSIVSCAEIKGKSKIQRVTVTLKVNDKTQDFNFELYKNYAEGTIEHFTYLANQGYYDNTVVSNLSNHVEFGSFYVANGLFKSKYDADATKSYASIIDDAYVSGKTLYYGKDKNQAANYPRYTSDHSIVGEFAARGYTLNELGLNGALVLKRDVITEETEKANAYDTGKATMAVTFGNDDYFTANSEFAIIGLICSDDGTGANGATDSSYERLKDLMNDYDADSAGNVYYYYNLGTADYYADLEIQNFGHYFMYDAEEKAYFAKDENGEFTVKIEADSTIEEGEEDPCEVILAELEENAMYLNVIPYAGVVITVEKITFAK